MYSKEYQYQLCLAERKDWRQAWLFPQKFRNASQDKWCFTVSSSSFMLWKMHSWPSCWVCFLSPWSDLPPIFLYIMAGFLAFVENFRIPRNQFTVNVHLRKALNFVKLCCEENIPFEDKFTQELRFSHDLLPWVPMESRAKLWSTKKLFGAEQCCNGHCNNWSKWGPVWKCKETNRKNKNCLGELLLKAVTLHPLTSPPRPNLKDCR